MTGFLQNFIIIAFQNISPFSNKILKMMSRRLSKAGNALMLITLVCLMVSCNTSGNKSPKETPTSGNIKIAVDESFQPLIDTEVYTFTSLYSRANITPEYKPEYDVINDFMNDSVKVMVTSRKLSENQIQYLRDTLVIARTVTFAYDALALVTNSENPDTLINYDTVKDIFSGKK
jgi:phosphate transport system substrate-binding protein